MIVLKKLLEEEAELKAESAFPLYLSEYNESENPETVGKLLPVGELDPFQKKRIARFRVVQEQIDNFKPDSEEELILKLLNRGMPLDNIRYGALKKLEEEVDSPNWPEIRKELIYNDQLWRREMEGKKKEEAVAKQERSFGGQALPDPPKQPILEEEIPTEDDQEINTIVQTMEQQEERAKTLDRFARFRRSGKKTAHENSKRTSSSDGCRLSHSGLRRKNGLHSHDPEASPKEKIQGRRTSRHMEIEDDHKQPEGEGRRGRC